MLSAGNRLGPYEILAPLGAGGMAILVTPDGRSLVYSYTHNLSDLYVVEGLK